MRQAHGKKRDHVEENLIKSNSPQHDLFSSRELAASIKNDLERLDLE
jgi:hypothetical protein